MPGFNQTGPMGLGSMTGKRMGRCTNFGANQKNEPTTENNTEPETITGKGLEFGFGRGQGGRGRVRGRGFGRGLGLQNRFRGGQ